MTSVYPLLFQFKVLVTGRGYLAGVTAHGTALMEQEEDGSWWMHGVEPGCMAETGKSPAEAYLRFSVAFRETLFDITEDCERFEDFEKAAREIFHQVDELDKARWAEAVEEFRTGTRLAQPPFTQLPRLPAETPRFIAIEQLNERPSFSAGEDTPDAPSMPLAA